MWGRWLACAQPQTHNDPNTMDILLQAQNVELARLAAATKEIKRTHLSVVESCEGYYSFTHDYTTHTC